MNRWRLELRHLFASRFALVAMALVFVCGICAIVAGANRCAAQRAELAGIEQVLRDQQGHLRNVYGPDADVGLVATAIHLPTAHEPSVWAALSTGLRDVHPISQPLRLLGLVPQLYEADFNSPFVELTGSFDFAFVVVHLLPLLVIGLCYDARSVDDDLGTARLLRSQPIRLSRVLLLRLGVRAVLVVGLVLALFAFAFGWISLPFDTRLVAFSLIVGSYLAIWFLLSLVVIALGRSSSWNAIALMTLWATSTVLAPALANLVVSAQHPIRGGIELTLAQREKMNTGWDRPKRATMDPFFARRIDLARAQVPEDRFSWGWYYAMHEIADASVAPAVREYRAAIDERQQSTARIAVLLPSLAVQAALDQVAATDLGTELAHRDSIAAYHEELKAFFYPLIFSSQKMPALDFDAIPRHRFMGHPAERWPRGMIGLGGFLLALCALTPWALRRIDRATVL